MKQKEDGKWIWDRKGGGKKGDQINNFEAGKDFVFFQGPAPKTGEQGLPDFFSKENLGDLEFYGVPQIAVTVAVGAPARGPAARPPSSPPHSWRRATDPS